MDCVMIGIAGGTGSGKTTLTNRIQQAFKGHAAVIYHDNYYKSRDGIPWEQRIRINYDHPDALETTLLLQQLDQLRQGHPIDCPIYDFSKHTRAKEVERIRPKKIILVEGLFVLADKALRDRMDIKVFVDCDEAERLRRRIARDTAERGRSAESVMQQCQETVIPMHNTYVQPSKQYADIIAQSGLDDDAFNLLKEKITQQAASYIGGNSYGNEYSAR